MKRDKGTQLREIRDGISRTIMIVESKRQIPWTKPVDLEYKKDGKLPKLGGFHQGGFNVAICNGAVHFIAATIDETVLRGLITKAGGEVVEFSSPKRRRAPESMLAPPRIR